MSLASRGRAVLAVAGMLCAVMAVFAQQVGAAPIPAYDIWGFTNDADSGEHISGANVELYHYSGIKIVDDTATSNGDGLYYFDGIASRLYGIEATHPRYRSAVSAAADFSGPSLRRDLELRPLAQRVWGPDRYSTSVAIARKGWGGPDGESWAGVRHVILACGEDRAAADPLAAAGLSWAYDAPVFLTPSGKTPPSVIQAIDEIRAQNFPITVFIVGGPVSVPDARYNELNGAGTLYMAKWRLISHGDRYDLAAAIALEMKDAALVNPAKTLPSQAFVANGADPSKFFDALALSPMSAGRGMPILLVSETSVPPQTSQALSQLGSNTVIIGGGPATVSDGVKSTLASSYTVERWSGSDRYATAAVIARKAIAEKGWSSPQIMGCSAKLPDALAGGALLGRYHGVLLLTQSTQLPVPTAAVLEDYDTSNTGAFYAFGGPVSVTEATREKMIDKLMVP